MLSENGKLFFFGTLVMCRFIPDMSHMNTRFFGLKTAAQILVVLTICIGAYNNCSSNFEGITVNSSTLPSSCSMSKEHLAAFNQVVDLKASDSLALEKPFQTSKISHSLMKAVIAQKLSLTAAATDESEAVVLVSNACIKGRSVNELSKATKNLRIDSQDENRQLWTYKIKTADLTLTNATAVSEIENDPCVIGIGPNLTYSLNAYSASDFNDTLYSQQSTLTRIDFFDSLAYFYRNIYGIGTSSTIPKATVAVIDTGVHYDHPDLMANMLKGANGYGVDAQTLGTGSVVYDARDIDTTTSHGTHVSGIIAAVGANGIGISGVAPKGVRILPIKAFYISGTSVTSDTDTISKGVIYATEQNVDVINLSLGGSGDDPVFKAALISAVNAGVFIAVAAGNDAKELSSTYKTYPASYSSGIDGLVSVASVDAATGSLSSFSNRSSTLVEIAAPGNTTGTTGMVSTFGKTQYASLRGTSQASPHVAAAAALIVALVREAGLTKPSPAVIENLLMTASTKSTGLKTSVIDGNLLNLKSLGALVNQRYPQTAGLTGGACP